MFGTKKRFAVAFLLCSFCFPLSHAHVSAAEKEKFRIAWTIYVGWMPWDYADQAGIVKKWADKYGIEIDVVQVNDYIESINQYTAGAFDGCVMTNMDALTIPAASGVDSTALIVGDFSDGNDAVILRDKKRLNDIKGQQVNLVELSVSHYLLARALESVGMSEKDITVVNTSDADLVSVFAAGDVTSTVTWNPLLSEIDAMPSTYNVFDSSRIPGEIIDLMVINTKTLTANPKLGKALTGAWYEIMSIMSKDDKRSKEARSFMATASGTDLNGYDAQLNTTRMFYAAKDAIEFTRSKNLPETMKSVANFSFEHGLLGDGAADWRFIGMAFPSGKIMGDKANIKLRFDDSFMQLAVEGKL
ncbi:MAG: ABC transporter substrate-binding protein [Gammaproteobacteria bacterium]|nr:ABC transporter substrate-binding protein [Gammaproteobacteria bacterium]